LLQWTQVAPKGGWQQAQDRGVRNALLRVLRSHHWPVSPLGAEEGGTAARLTRTPGPAWHRQPFSFPREPCTQASPLSDTPAVGWAQRAGRGSGELGVGQPHLCGSRVWLQGSEHWTHGHGQEAQEPLRAGVAWHRHVRLWVAVQHCKNPEHTRGAWPCAGDGAEPSSCLHALPCPAVQGGPGLLCASGTVSPTGPHWETWTTGLCKSSRPTGHSAETQSAASTQAISQDGPTRRTDLKSTRSGDRMTTPQRCSPPPSHEDHRQGHSHALMKPTSDGSHAG
jgi:hypothetical protein